MEKTMDKIIALAKSRGFVYPGSEIYGGLANTWDYGNLTPHGSIKSGRPPRRSIVALSHSANLYLLLLGVTRFIAAVAIFAGS